MTEPNNVPNLKTKYKIQKLRNNRKSQQIRFFIYTNEILSTTSSNRQK